MKRFFVAFGLVMVLLVGGIALAGSVQQIVATSSTPVNFTAVSVAEGRECAIRNGGYAVFVTWEGTAPTTTTGFPLQANDFIEHLTVYEFNSFKAIASSTTSTLYGICN